jgi:hypothetical protein
MFSDRQPFAGYSLIEIDLEECPVVDSCKDVYEPLGSIRERSFLIIVVGCQFFLRRLCAVDLVGSGIGTK